MDGLVSGATEDRIDAEAEARDFFASLHVRDYEDIFDTDLIPRIISGDTGRVVPLRRYASAAAFVLGAVLNVLNIALQFYHGIPSQLELLARWRSGQWGLFCLLPEPDTSAGRCQHADADAHSFHIVLLAWTELAMLTSSAVFSMWGLCQLAEARTDDSSVESFRRWGRVSTGFEWLESLGSASAMKILPKMMKPHMEAMEAVRSYKMMKNLLTEEDDVYSTSDKFYAVSSRMFPFLRILVVGLAGIFALHSKLKSVVFLYKLPMNRWHRKYWLTFIGFVYQVSGLIPVSALKKETILFFIFTGEDAEMHVSEYRAMQKFNARLYKAIFRTCGTLCGLVVGMTISHIDLQKIVITERARESHAKIA